MSLQHSATKMTKDWSAFLEQKESTEISKSKISKSPYASVGKLFIQEQGYASQVGTGFKIGPRLVLTAGHCVGNVISNEGMAFFHSDIIYCPQFPYETKSYKATKLSLPTEYIHDKHIQHDFGFVQFDEDLPGEILNIDFSANQTGSCEIIGYPDYAKYFGNRMYSRNSAYHKKYVEDFYVFSDIDFTSGSSGGPIIDKATGSVISLISSSFGNYKERQMAGPIMRDMIKGYVDELAPII